MKMHNFYAGPAILPASVMAEAAEGVRDLDGIGLSVLEISHRSKEFTAIIEEAEALIRELLGVSDDFAVLFMSGGASSQFFLCAMNLLNENETAAYIDTGSWSAKAIKEAKLFGKVAVAASSKADGYTYIPKEVKIPEGSKYVHLTSNNTIFGTQFHSWPDTDMPLVCDASSDIFSRPLEMDRFGLIYAGAQKNLGPAGVTLAIIRKDMLGHVNREIPAMLNYQTFVDNDSLYNTPPVFPIYTCMLTLRWIKAKGGLKAMQQHNEAKGNLLYDEIDSNPLFKAVIKDKASRSLMNVTFAMSEGNEDREQDFLDACAAANCIGIEGHRSVGGFRASIYNAMPQSSVQVLVDVMKSL